MKKTRKRKGMEEPEVMCGLCQHTTMVWLGTNAPPQVMFDSLGCLLANIVSQTVIEEQQVSAVEQITSMAKDMVMSKAAAGKLN